MTARKGKPLRLADDLYWRVQRVATRAGFDSVQAFVHVILEGYCAAHPLPGKARASSLTL